MTSRVIMLDAIAREIQQLEWKYDVTFHYTKYNFDNQYEPRIFFTFNDTGEEVDFDKVIDCID
jgi:hypothetical protein